MGKPFALIVEDDRELSAALTAVLQFNGLATQQVYDGRVALDTLAESVPDIIILDMHLPSVSGDHILAEIRADDRLADAKVVVITADHLIATTVDHIGDLILLKPVSFEQVTGLIQRLVGKTGFETPR